MKEQETNKNKENKSERNQRSPVNIGLLAGLIAGGALGALIGYLTDDMPLYTAFGMILGMALALDLTPRRKDSDLESKNTHENEKKDPENL